jgi:hypothetical protein
LNYLHWFEKFDTSTNKFSLTPPSFFLEVESNIKRDMLDTHVLVRTKLLLRVD